MSSVLYLDEHLAVWAKPSGELVHPGWARGEPTSMSRLRDHLNQHVYPVHRLDRGTSGCVLMARTRECASALGKQVMAGGLTKRYLALVRGRFEGEQLLDHPVYKGERGGDRVPAQTWLAGRGVSSVARCSLVAAEPRTGRLHQIRRHLKHLSHPIVGDVRYGDGRVNRAFRADFALHRLALHATSLAFVHPVTGDDLEVEAPLPPDLREPLVQLGLL